MPMTLFKYLVYLIGCAVHTRPVVDIENHRVEVVDIHQAMHCRIQWDIYLIVLVRGIKALSSLCEYALNRKGYPIDRDAASCWVGIGEEIARRGRSKQRNP